MHVKLFVCGLAACVAVGLSGLSPRVGGDEPAKQGKADPSKEFASIQKDWSSAQQAFFKAYQKLQQFQGHAKFSTWLVRIALNESFMKLRKTACNPGTVNRQQRLCR